jgi:hypothetical protein
MAFVKCVGNAGKNGEIFTPSARSGCTHGRNFSANPVVADVLA